MDVLLRHVTGLGVAKWRSVAAGTLERARRERLGLVAAGSAFWGTLSLFPSLIVLLMVYGLVSETGDVERQVRDLLGSVSAETQAVVSNQLRSLVRSERLGWGLFIGLAGFLWTASNGMANAIKAVALAYGEDESRPFMKLRLLALAFTLGALVVVGAAAAIVALLPIALDRADGISGIVLSVFRWGGLLVLLATGITVLYRYAPRSRHGDWGSAIKGAITVSAAWGAVTAVFAIYVRSVSRYTETYGALAGFITLMIWLYLTSFLIVGGAAVAAEISEVREAESKAKERADTEPTIPTDAASADDTLRRHLG